jgi:hypothetical protein
MYSFQLPSKEDSTMIHISWLRTQKLRAGKNNLTLLLVVLLLTVFVPSNRVSSETQDISAHLSIFFSHLSIRSYVVSILKYCTLQRERLSLT